MFILYALKTFFRKLLSSTLLTLLLAATSVLLSLSLGLSYAVDIICNNLDGFYTTLAIIRPGPVSTDYANGESSAYRSDKWAYEKLITTLFEEDLFEHIQMIDRRRTVMGVVENVNTLSVGELTGQYVQNSDFDTPNNAVVLIVKKVSEGVHNSFGISGQKTVVTQVIAASDSYEHWGEVILMWPMLFNPNDWKEGESYIVCGVYGERSLDVEKNFPDLLTIRTPTDFMCELSSDGSTVYGMANYQGSYREGVFYPTADKIPILTPIDVPLEEFWETEIGKEWKTLTIPYIEKNISALYVTGTDNVQGIQYFNTGKARLAEGRYINSSEYSTGADVCMVSTVLAEANGWSVGDQISMETYSAKSGVTDSSVGQFAIFQPTTLCVKYNAEVQEQKNYTIVGLYQTESVVVGDQYYINPNTVFVPNNSLHAEYEFGVADANRLSIVIPNGKLDAFKAEAEELGYGDFFLYNDQGYSAIADTLLAIQDSAGSILNMSLGLWIFSLLLVVFLFLLMQRKYAATMWQLGCKKGNIFVYILTQLGVLSIISAVLAFIGSNALYEKVVTWMISGNISQFDDAFSALSTSGGTVEEVMGYLTQSPETFLKIVGVQLVAFVVVFAVSALAFSLADHRAKK